MSLELSLYNTVSRTKERFEPSHDTVGLYCCGPTVYNYAHIGNLRTYIFEDVLKRTLRAHGYKIRHVMNITDVGHLVSDADSGEDKMEKGATREGKTVWEVAEYFTLKFKENIHELNIVDPDSWHRATDFISQMIDLIALLDRKGFTYRTTDGVYFDTTKFPTYCDFARLDPSSLRAGDRVEMGEKRSPTDFALWKFSPPDKKRQMEWESPWGVGFPGWHIECSVMSMADLPLPIDIHCGGADHIPVHHTNEIAQSEAATGKQFVKYWVHGEFLVIDKGKMAKSGENFITLDSLKIRGISPLGYRFFTYSAHYRSPLTFSYDGVKASEQSLVNLRRLLTPETGEPDHVSVDDAKVGALMEPFYKACYDDLNMPRAVASLWEVARSETISSDEKVAIARKADEILGLDLLRTEEEVPRIELETGKGTKIKIATKTQLSDAVKGQIVQMVADRKQARAERDFKKADRIRDELTAAGIVLKDLPDGTTECEIGDSGPVF